MLQRSVSGPKVGTGGIPITETTSVTTSAILGNNGAWVCGAGAVQPGLIGPGGWAGGALGGELGVRKSMPGNWQPADRETKVSRISPVNKNVVFDRFIASLIIAVMARGLQ